jgi:peptidyl-dipeptidase Dcp
MTSPAPVPNASFEPNPLRDRWTGPFEIPPFDRIAPEHFGPAFAAAFAEHKAEIERIAADGSPPIFENTIAALERSGKALDRVSSVFFNLAGAETSDAIEAIERDITPKLSRHRSDMYANEALFRKIEGLYAARETLGLRPEAARVLERYYVTFMRNGAGLSQQAKVRLAEIGERLATLGTQFGQNVLADERAFLLVLDSPEDLAGLPASLVAAAARAGADRGFPGKHVITLARSSVEPFLQFSARRDLREKAFRAWIARGESGGATDNSKIAAEMVRLRAERAKLLGYTTFAEFRLADTMAKTPEAALDLLRSVWAPAKEQVARDVQALQALVSAEGGNFTLAPWDWRYYAEKLRKLEHDLDEAETKPYLPLDNMIEALFYTARRLFGLAFEERFDIALYHEDARAFTVRGSDGAEIALFIGDYFARPSKRSGAWMSTFRDQQKLDGKVLPIVVNVLNFAKAGAGAACLLSYDDAHTLFHEFGHALHGLLSDVTFPKLAGTAVARDFVEFPSQLFEHWLEQPEILRRFALHHETGAPMPDALIERLRGARGFNQGFATVEFAASALVDLALHMERDPGSIDVLAFERAELARLGMPETIVMRHRTPHFQHIFSGEGYSAGYYSYLWSEILDADGFEAFEEAGDIFDPVLAERLHAYVYSAGYSRTPAEAYERFRGRAPSSQALLRKRGFATA